MTRRELLRATAVGLAASLLPQRALAASETNPLPVMRTRSIPSSKESLPVIGLGTWQTFDVGSSATERDPLEAVLREFVALGGRVVDSSPMYGRSEQVAGDLMSKLGLREKLFVATKVWTSGRQAGITQMEDSERKLQAKPLDLLQVHNLVDVDTHLATLRDWKAAGRVRYVGVTHYTASQHAAVERMIASQPLDFVQINYSVGERDAEKRLLPLARDRGVAVLVNRPFVGGDLLRRLAAKPLPAWAAEIECTSWSQLLLKFVVSHPAVTCAIPATSKVEHLRDNMKAGVGRMPDEAMRARIAAAALG
jgi:diketogulonate reductase-like aldo/keto reductase